MTTVSADCVRYFSIQYHLTAAHVRATLCKKDVLVLKAAREEYRCKLLQRRQRP